MIQHTTSHELGEAHPNVSGWSYCQDCHYVICDTCRKAICTCGMTNEEVHDREQARLMRAGRTKVKKPADSLGIATDTEVGSTDTEEHSPTGDTRPQEGHEIMATAPDEQAEKKATKKKSTTKKATGVKKSTAAKAKAADKRGDAEARRGKGELEAAVLDVVQSFDDGHVTLDEGKTLTPHTIAKIIGDGDEDNTPSPGAISATLKRWELIGFILVHDKPYAYRRLTAKGKNKGLDALKEQHRDKLKAERAAAREEKKAAKEAADA